MRGPGGRFQRKPAWFFHVPETPRTLPVSGFIPGTVSSPDCLLNQGKSSLIPQIWPVSICATAADSSEPEKESERERVIESEGERGSDRKSMGGSERAAGMCLEDMSLC